MNSDDDEVVRRTLFGWQASKMVLVVLLIASGFVAFWQLGMALLLLGVAGLVWWRGRRSATG